MCTLALSGCSRKVRDSSTIKRCLERSQRDLGRVDEKLETLLEVKSFPGVRVRWE